jgi:hypothetical protein
VTPSAAHTGQYKSGQAKSQSPCAGMPAVKPMSVNITVKTSYGIPYFYIFKGIKLYVTTKI